jgi:hypothetical protein
MKNLCFTIPILFAVVLLTACSSKNTHEPPNGLRIARQEHKPNEIADLLDLKIWKFSVEFPDRANWVTWSLETHEQNKPPAVLATGAFRFDGKTRNGELVVGINPLGSELGLSESIRYIVQIAGNGNSGTSPNPFKGSNSRIEPCNVAVDPESEQGDICLMQGIWTDEQNSRKRQVDLYLAAKATPATSTSAP